VDGSDNGFTILEMTVALAVMGIITAAVTTFFIRTITVINYERGKQVAIQLTDDAIERARALKGSAILAGRDHSSVHDQFTVPKASSLLGSQQLVWDTTALLGAGATAALPTAPRTVTVNGVAYKQYWYVGACWQPRAGGACDVTPDAVAYFRVVVAVTWVDKACTGDCSFVASTLVSNAAQDPVFNSNQTSAAPTVINPGNLATDVTVTLTRTLTASGGAPPLTWSSTGLPATMQVTSNGTLTGTPTVPGTYNVTITATDGFGKVGSAAFTFTVNALPALTDPGMQQTVHGTAVNYTVPMTGGTGPMAWTAAGLPSGLTINPTTGAITGTAGPVSPTTQVTVTVTDFCNKTSSVKFGWNIQ
jgi:prepilin-type N-terminal cleavage/methylation domain-containing protein